MTTKERYEEIYKKAMAFGDISSALAVAQLLAELELKGSKNEEHRN